MNTQPFLSTEIVHLHPQALPEGFAKDQAIIVNLPDEVPGSSALPVWFVVAVDGHVAIFPRTVGREKASDPSPRHMPRYLTAAGLLALKRETEHILHAEWRLER